MVSDFERQEKERTRRRQEIKELTDAGWKSTGDLPYEFARSLGIRASVFETHIVGFREDVLAKEGEDYSRANCKKIGQVTLVSPDLIQKLEHEIRVAFGRGE